MTKTGRFEKFILGDTNIIQGIDRSRILFLARTTVVIISISLFFLAYDIYLGYLSSLFVYIPFVIAFGYSLYLLRNLKYNQGNFIVLFSLNFFIYIVMSSIPEDSMSAIFYIGLMVVEYVLVGHERKPWLYTLLGITFVLYLCDTYIDFSLLPMRFYDERTLQVNKLVDFVICVLGVLMSVKLLIDYLQFTISERNKDNEKLKQANTQLDKYSYTITHDLKGSIHSMLRLIELPILDKSNYEQHLDDMKENLQNIVGMIDEVSEQAYNQNLDLKKEEFNILQLVEVTWDLIKHTPEAERIDLTLDIPKELVIKTDKRRMSGILNNLITNAIRYRDESKNNQFIKLSGYESNGWFHMNIVDNGVGIEKHFQEKVFDMFYRASNRLGGSGLGLFIVKESVNKLSGQITLESKAGMGTTFSMKIPMAASKK